MCNKQSECATVETIESMASQLEEIAILFRNVADAMHLRKEKKIVCGNQAEVCAALDALQAHGEKVCRQLREF